VFSEENVILIGFAVTLMPKKKEIKLLSGSYSSLDGPKHSHFNLLNKVRLQPTDWQSYLRISFEHSVFQLSVGILLALYVVQARPVQLVDFMLHRLFVCLL
jgi:hypothetical protein